MQVVNGWLRALPRWAVWLLGLLPLAWVVWLTLTNGLGVDPVREIEHRLGKIGLWFLIGGLAITPLRRLTGITLLRQRRDIGLLAFLYVLLHLTAWAVLDMGMLWAQAAADLVKRPYLIFGILAFLLMVPLALTSSDRAVRALGARWRKLHWLTYPAVGLGVVHYLWQMKVVTGQGWLWLGALIVLLALRLIWALRRRAGRVRAG